MHDQDNVFLVITVPLFKIRFLNKTIFFQDNIFRLVCVCTFRNNVLNKSALLIKTIFLNKTVKLSKPIYENQSWYGQISFIKQGAYSICILNTPLFEQILYVFKSM